MKDLCRFWDLSAFPRGGRHGGCATVEAPPSQFAESAMTRAVIGSSRFYANANYCELIRRYQLKTNAEVNAALNLFKHRAYQMGARRVVFVSVDVASNHSDPGDVEIVTHLDVPKNRRGQYSIVVGDLYECPTKL